MEKGGNWVDVTALVWDAFVPEVRGLGVNTFVLPNILTVDEHLFLQGQGMGLLSC